MQVPFFFAAQFRTTKLSIDLATCYSEFLACVAALQHTHCGLQRSATTFCVPVRALPNDSLRRTNYDGDTIYQPVFAFSLANHAVTFEESGLPSFLTMSAKGIITGNVPVVAENSGPYTVTIKAKDVTTGVTTSQTFGWTIGNAPPKVTDGEFWAEKNTGLTDLDMTYFADDVEGDALDVIIVSGPSHGTLTENTDGTYHYVRTTDWMGTDTITYKVNDGTTDSNTATLSIHVGYLVPTANPDEYDITSSGATVITLSGDSDESGPAYLITALPERGTLYDGANSSGHQIVARTVVLVRQWLVCKSRRAFSSHGINFR